MKTTLTDERKEVRQMARCTRTWGLEVHHKQRDGGVDIGNAKVLCQKCHEATGSYGVSGKESPDFDEETKKKAKINAGNQCECTSTQGCH